MSYIGRPSKYKNRDSDVVQKLKEAMLLEMNITEACKYAGIARQTFYNYRDQHEDFLDEISRFRSILNVQNRKVLYKALTQRVPEYKKEVKRVRKWEAQLAFRYLWKTGIL